MTEPEKARHEKMKAHLRAATKLLHEQALLAQESAQEHLDNSTPTKGAP